MRPFLLLAPALFLSACISLNPAKRNSLNAGLTIGLIADTQYTTDKLTEEYGFRSVLADKFANVAIRTTAQETLALHNLKYLFHDMSTKNVDVIFYLGDGVNSGCSDEIENFFDQLDKSRKSLQKPIFFVPGNHDYLATGNQTGTKVRLNTCGENNGIVTKGELVRLVSKFNRKSHSTFSNKNVFTKYRDNLDKSSGIYLNCSPSAEEDQHRDGCFYSGLVSYSKNGINGELLLVDTSDYTDIALQPDIKLTELYGVRGSISWNEKGQISWFKENFDERYQDTRILATHYPIANLGYTWIRVGRPGDLLLKGKNKNLWLSAHTHTADPSKGVTTNRFSDKLFFNVRQTTQINVGSTTDYLPHYSVVSFDGFGTTKSSYPTLEEYENLNCKTYIENLSKAEHLQPVLDNSKDWNILLGVTGDYRDSNYNTKNARKNILHLLENQPNSEKEKFVKCLVATSAKNEIELRSILPH